MALISGIVITYNEQAHIGDCIASLQRVCDDVVVVDSLSTDGTVAIARDRGARVVEQEFLGDGPQRQLAARHARHDWILCLDADERVDDEMVGTIRSLPLSQPEVAYAFNRKSFVGKHWIDGPGFYPDYVPRLFNRQRADHNDRLMHASVVAPRVRRASGHILHYSYEDLSDWIASIDHLSTWGARQLFESGRGPSTWSPALRALTAGVRQLVLRGGILRGVDGRTVAMTSMFYTYMKYLKLNEMHEHAGDVRPTGPSAD